MHCSVLSTFVYLKTYKFKFVSIEKIYDLKVYLPSLTILPKLVYSPSIVADLLSTRRHSLTPPNLCIFVYFILSTWYFLSLVRADLFF